MDMQMENEILRDSNKILRERQLSLMNEIDNINREKKELQVAIDYKRDLIYDLQVRNENYLDEIRTLKDRIKCLQNVIEKLGGENGQIL